MNISELKAQLRTHPELNVNILRPDGTAIPAHYHLTEVGHVAKNFVDCGGKFRASETCVLQTHFGSTRDDGHRLTAGKFAMILDLAKPILPTEDLLVEVEYEAGVISQAPLAGVRVVNGALQLQLGAAFPEHPCELVLWRQVRELERSQRHDDDGRPHGRHLFTHRARACAVQFRALALALERR